MKMEILASVSSGLFPNIKPGGPGELLARLENGARVIVRYDDGAHTVVRYLHGPYASAEVERLGLAAAGVVRIRQQPDGFWKIFGPPELAGTPEEIPVELRGRHGNMVNGVKYKYEQHASIKLHRVIPGELRRVVRVPLIWLETITEKVGCDDPP
jgi:hypothetical protein